MHFPNRAALAFSLLLTSCYTAGPDHSVPETAAPATFKGSSETESSRPADRWWRAFGDGTLNSLVADLERGNLDLRTAYARRSQALATLGVAGAGRVPQLSGDGGVQRSRTSENDLGGGQFRPLSTRYQIGAAFGYELDLWGRVRRVVEAARADADAADISIEDVRLSLQAQLAQSYFALRFIDSEAAVLRQAVTAREDTLDLAKGRFEGGSTSEVDVARAETELATTQAGLAALEAPRARLENAIAVLAGKHPSSFSLTARSISKPPPKIPSGIPAGLLGRRPDVLAAERTLAASSARIGAAQAEFFPKISLTKSGGFASINSSSFLDWSSRTFAIGPEISLPLFQGGRLRGAVARARAQHEEAVAAYQKTVLTAFADVETALASRAGANHELAAYEKSVVAAGRAFDLSNLRYQEGLTSYIEVLDSQRERLNAQRSRVQALGRSYESTVQLTQALGGSFSSR